MKKLLYVFMLLIVSSCVNDEFEGGLIPSGDSVAVEFRVDVPDVQPVASRAINENLISDLQLLVFDEDGRFISRHQATLGGPTYSVTLPRSGSRRIVHFVANYNWTNFDDQASQTKDEGELIAPLQSTDLIFWQRVVLDSGIDANAFTQAVALLRNMAKFTLTNQVASGLTNVEFSLCNIASAGSVAPFNTANRTFESVITEPVGVNFTNSTAFGSGDIFVFERENSIVIDMPTYVIIKGIYQGISYYYKIDIVDENKNLYDITRNVLFSVVIQSVTKAGYSTIDEAKNSPASNNISASVLLQSYPTISDGSYVLSVDKTIRSFTANGQTLNANAIYKTIGGVVDNSAVVVTLTQDAAAPVVVGGSVSYDPVTGNITAAIHDVPANGVAYRATINVAAGNLSRTIRLMLHEPFDFENMVMTPSVVGNVQDSPTSLKFTIPDEAEYLLPFNTYITTAYLTPEFGNIEVVYENGQYKYKYKITSIGEHTINFLTNTQTAAEMIFVEADLFERGEVAYTNTSGINCFSNVMVNPNPVDFGVGNPVRLKFTVPTAGTFEIHTSNLDAVNGSVVGGIYTHTATQAGEQVIDFTTNKVNSREIIDLKATSYKDHAAIMKNQLVNISGIFTYNNPSTIINRGVVTVTVGAEVLGIFPTDNTGAYSASLEVNIGDVLTFSYSRGSVYRATHTVTAADMVINKTLYI